MDCYKWELEALIKGLTLRNIDERENLAELAANVRYTIHSKKVKSNKLFDKRKEEAKVINLFEDRKQGDDFALKVQKLNDYFRNK